MKTVSYIHKKLKNLPASLIIVLMFVFSSCSTVKEQGEPDATTPTVITTDEQRQAIYERGVENTAPQNANPIPPSNQLGLDEKASEINRKKNIENMDNQNAPSNTPVDERPRQLRNVGNDTIVR